MPDFPDREFAIEVVRVILAALRDEHVVRSFSRASSRSHEKGFRDVVTDSDVNIQDRLENELTQLLPGSQFQSEEGPKESAGHLSGYNWTVDPIDGTVNYSRGLYPFTCAALLSLGIDPLIGVVVEPIGRTAVVGMQEGGCFSLFNSGGRSSRVNPTHCVIRETPSTLSSIMLTPKHDEMARRDSLTLIGDLLRETSGARILVSQAYEAMSFCRGGLDSVISLHSSGGWTSGVSKLLCRESGGFVLDIDPNLADRKHGFALVATEDMQQFLADSLQPLGYTVSKTL